MKKLYILAAVVLSACGAAAAPTSSPAPTSAPSPTLAPTTAPSPTPPLHVLTGTFVLDQTDEPVEFSPSDCSGTAGYDDITSGLQVVVKDGSGTVIATGSLGPGTFIGIPLEDGATSGQGVGSCSFSISVLNVPEVPFYSIEVGRRGALTYSLAEMKTRAFTVSFTLG